MIEAGCYNDIRSSAHVAESAARVCGWRYSILVTACVSLRFRKHAFGARALRPASFWAAPVPGPADLLAGAHLL